LDRNKLGDLLSKLRRSRDLSLEAMGELLHVSGRTVRRWEKGEILPTMEDVINISNEFNISLEEIYEGEINIDREVNRKLSTVGSSIEAIDQKIVSTDETVKKINDGIIEIKDHFLNSSDAIAQKEPQENSMWIKLLVAHVIGVGAGFICYIMGSMRYIIAFLFTIIYVVYLTWIIITERNNRKTQRVFFVYSILLLVNMLINYVLFADITIGVINNVELMLVNGAMYGLRLLDLDNMSLLLFECVVTYGFWIMLSGYCLIKKNK
jgi:transcriptional regulator with XRE-family HTH domain